MISNISKSSHSGFARLAKYTLGKEKSRYLGGNVAYCDPFSMPELPTNVTHSFANPMDIAKNFWLTPGLSSCEKPCCHISLSLPPEEDDLEDEEWHSLCKDYLSGMGFANENQYFVVKHDDRDHAHIHIVANRIGVVSGDVVSSSFDYYRSQSILRDLEKKYGLETTPSSWEQKSKKPIELGDSEAIQTKVDRTIKTLFSDPSLTPNLTNFAHVLIEQEGVGLSVKTNAKGNPYLLYTAEDREVAGHRLGQNYRLKELTRKGISFVPQVDTEAIQIIPKKVAQAEIMVPPVLDIWRIMALEKHTRVEGARYSFSISKEFGEVKPKSAKKTAQSPSGFYFQVHRKSPGGENEQTIFTLRSPNYFPEKETVRYRIAEVDLTTAEVETDSPFRVNAEHFRDLLRRKLDLTPQSATPQSARAKSNTKTKQQDSFLSNLL